MDTISYVGLLSVYSTIKAHANIIIAIHYYCILTLCYQFLPSVAYPVPLTVFTNMSCYTSLCTSSTLGTSPIFLC